jgi:dTDP-4-dehydrorhamnose reductase
MKILITGGSGLLGQYLNVALSKENEILTLYNSNEGNCKNYSSEKLALTDYKKLSDIFNFFRPDIVVHTAAISRPELCDKLPRNFVLNVNVNSTKEISRLCEKYEAKMIFTSTDLVYDGDSGLMLTEESKINPISLYAETKLQSEAEIKDTFDNYIILRTSLLYGIGLNHSVNNFHNMYFNFRSNKKVKLFYDQFRTPLALADAAELISRLIRLNIKNITLNFGGRERVSRTELGEMLCDICNFDRNLIERISMAEVPTLHKVSDVSMNTNKLQALGLNQKSIQESIAEMMSIL